MNEIFDVAGAVVGALAQGGGALIDVAGGVGGALIDGAGQATQVVRTTGTSLVVHPLQLLSDPNENLAAATDIFCGGRNDSLRSLLSRVMRRTQEAVEGAEANTILEAVRNIYCKAAGTVVKEVAFEVVRYSLLAFGLTDFANALLIWQGILTNQVNTATLAFILERKSDLALFLIDLIEPAKLYVPAFPSESSRGGQQANRRDNQYNELDLTQPGNRHAVICQLQRLAKSLAHILLKGKEGARFDQLHMDTTLRSDFGENGRVINQSALTIPAKRNKPSNERWIFVNGIGGEYFWLELNCTKLRDTFNRDIRGVFNRGDGILWDLVECAGERNIDGPQNNLIERTTTSRAAQRSLAEELSVAFENRNPGGVIVMIAYSQGCLLLRLVLQDFIRRNEYRDQMATRLRVFTFGNPSIDWMAMSGENRIPICERINHTEHFANQRDFVAKLGVLRTFGDETVWEEDLRTAGYKHEKSLVFVNISEEWIGHLFGAQYSLRADDYVNGQRSKLLACVGGVREME